MEIEIPTELYELLLNRAVKTQLSIEETVEHAIKKFMERGEDNAD